MVDSVGEPSDNLLIQGDALHALRALSRVPELRARYQGKVRLCYIDPPFNTGQAFAHYDDALENSVWLTMLRDRLAQIRDLLAPDGSVWLHLDDAQQHRGRAVLDEVFGAEAFVATVIWERTDLPSMAAGKFTMKNGFITSAQDKRVSAEWVRVGRRGARSLRSHRRRRREGLLHPDAPAHRPRRTAG